MSDKRKTLAEYQKQIKDPMCNCGFNGLDTLPIEHYPHSGGWFVQDMEGRQWLYVTCPKCGYQWALWKLGVPR